MFSEREKDRQKVNLCSNIDNGTKQICSLSYHLFPFLFSPTLFPQSLLTLTSLTCATCTCVHTHVHTHAHTCACTHMHSYTLRAKKNSLSEILKSK